MPGSGTGDRSSTAFQPANSCRTGGADERLALSSWPWSAGAWLGGWPGYGATLGFLGGVQAGERFFELVGDPPHGPTPANLRDLGAPEPREDFDDSGASEADKVSIWLIGSELNMG